ncbi:hypothetical protein Taro_048450 [Colocasia esculenta]|uniref:Uncharacterized protein n=1 Tax=Colocasia esculenta TaxID=4460 RepID=A0A843X2W0_COLES|nr:hypothetical protein [Colocasia esculenta]
MEISTVIKCPSVHTEARASISCQHEVLKLFLLCSSALTIEVEGTVVTEGGGDGGGVEVGVSDLVKVRAMEYVVGGAQVGDWMALKEDRTIEVEGTVVTEQGGGDGGGVEVGVSDLVKVRAMEV